jgi:hypothetical protein
MKVQILTQKISDFLIVNFDKGAANQHFQSVVAAVGVYDLEYMVEHVRHDAALSHLVRSTADHGVGLAAAGLAIGKHRAVVSGEGSLNNRKGCFVVNVLLRGVFIKYSIEPKCLVLVRGSIS